MEPRSAAARTALTRLIAAVLAASAAFGACTQEVVVVDGGGGAGGDVGAAVVGVGVGGQSDQGGSSSSQGTVSSVSSGTGECSTPAPVGTLADCAGSAVGSGSGGPINCEQTMCDGAQNTWIAACGPTGCTCSYNGSVVCSCTFVAPAEGCDTVEGNGCCPAPWADP